VITDRKDLDFVSHIGSLLAVFGIKQFAGIWFVTT